MKRATVSRSILNAGVNATLTEVVLGLKDVIDRTEADKADPKAKDVAQLMRALMSQIDGARLDYSLAVEKLDAAPVNERDSQLTEKERGLLKAMRQGMDEPGNGWLHEVSYKADLIPSSIPGVVGSLVKKGVIDTHEHDPGDFWFQVRDEWM